MKKFFLILLIAGMAIACKDNDTSSADHDTAADAAAKEDSIEMSPEQQARKEANKKKDLNAPSITPIEHATFVLKWDKQVIYVDPVGGAAPFKNMGDPDFIFITDIHGDHMNAETINAVKTPKTKIYAPQAVADKLPSNIQVNVINNGESMEVDELSITAIPMYNLSEERLKFHEKGRGNGYVLNKYGYNLYISGDTEDIPEMRELEDIDMALVCMNLPYTMPWEKAADAVLEFKPRAILPYHYRGTDGYESVDSFAKKIGNSNDEIEVRLLNWYPNKGKE
ncbi:MAG: MBL fold metallo-hydrolase [Nonlabens sp.]